MKLREPEKQILDDFEHKVTGKIAKYGNEPDFPKFENYGITRMELDDYLFDKQAILDMGGSKRTQLTVGGNYFDELLARIRDIRSSEKVFYRKILEIYALSIDYDPRVEMTQKFFKTVQNKMHYSVHGHTAAEIIYERADAQKDFMGLTTWSGAMPTKPEAEIAKNYLTQDEIKSLNRIVSLYLDFAEMQAEEHRPMYMKDWINILDDFLRISRKDILTHAGKISAKLAKEKADTEYDKFKERTKNDLSPVEIHFLENFERERKRLSDDSDKADS